MFSAQRPREGHDNNFHLMRHAAALAVILTHSFSVVSGRLETEPFYSSMQHSIGNYAVDVFFVLSGFLVTQSFARDRDLLRFVVARALRIFPALVFAVLATALVLGPLVSTLPLREYLGDGRLLDYIAGTLSTSSAQFPLPGVFEALPTQDTVNASLWTLKYELAAYLTLALVFALGALKSRRSFLASFAVLLLLYVAGRAVLPWPAEDPPAASNAIHLFLSFYFGVAAYVFRDRIPLSIPGLALVVAAAAATHYTPAREFFELLAIAYFVLWLAFVPKLGSNRLSRYGDFSYGLYIFAFPIQQTIRLALPDITPIWVFLFATALTLPLAALSWHLIEQPALSCRGALVRLIRKGFALARKKAGLAGHARREAASG